MAHERRRDGMRRLQLGAWKKRVQDTTTTRLAAINTSRGLVRQSHRGHASAVRHSSRSPENACIACTCSILVISPVSMVHWCNVGCMEALGIVTRPSLGQTNRHRNHRNYLSITLSHVYASDHFQVTRNSCRLAVVIAHLNSWGDIWLDGD